MLDLETIFGWENMQSRSNNFYNSSQKEFERHALAKYKVTATKYKTNPKNSLPKPSHNFDILVMLPGWAKSNCVWHSILGRSVFSNTLDVKSQFWPLFQHTLTVMFTI